jgi:ABC-2 type transport system permease protein
MVDGKGINYIGLYTLIRREVERTFRVVVQTLVTPWITALLYIFVFGSVVGSRISEIGGVPYIQFVLPGILVMNVILASFGASSSAMYMKRFMKDIEEILVAPLSYIEMILGLIIGTVIRSLIVALGIFVIAVLFGGAVITHILLFIFYILAISIAFSLLGIIVGLWAKGFESFSVISTFLITPLSFLGGVFYSKDMLPKNLQFIVAYNPFFYFTDGVRYSMIGLREGSANIGYAMIVGSILVLGAIVWYLFKIGWRIRT